MYGGKSRVLKVVGWTSQEKRDKYHVHLFLYNQISNGPSRVPNISYKEGNESKPNSCITYYMNHDSAVIRKTPQFNENCIEDEA